MASYDVWHHYIGPLNTGAGPGHVDPLIQDYYNIQWRVRLTGLPYCWYIMLATSISKLCQEKWLVSKEKKEFSKI